MYTLSTSKLAEASAMVNKILDGLGVRSEGLGHERKGDEHFLRFTVHTSPEKNRRLMQQLLQLKEIDDIQATEEPPS